jgi:polyhydroxyalkanoate synthase
MTQHPQAPPRLGPRPLPLHMAMEGWILQMSFAGLMASKGALPLSKDLLQSLSAPLARLLAEAGEKNPPTKPEAFIYATAREATQRMEEFVRGVRAYQAHPFRRSLSAPPPVWRRGAATLHDYGGEGAPVLYVPSLVNRAYILDLAEDRSLLRTSAAQCLRSYLLDWGDPGPAERQFTMTDYVEGVLIPALEEIKAQNGRAPHLVGYCMGGTLAVVPAVLRPDLVASLVVLAAPWDFHAGTEASRMLLGFSRPMVELMLETEHVLSVDVLNALFASLDPTLVGRKFRRFAAMDSASDAAQRFVELEDWLNDGVPLAGPVAREALFGWYFENTPASRQWRVGGAVIDPARISCRTLAFIPAQDRIVPPESAQALVAAIPGAEAVSVDLGHIGMTAAGNAPTAVYRQLLHWLKSA